MSDFLLPDRLPAIVLPSCTFLPHGLLPLYIFEEKYRSMLGHALEGERMFCVAMVRAGEEEETSHIGTAGVIRACVRNPDGTSHLLLQGVRRARFLHWDAESEFPLAEVEWVETEIHDPKRCQELAAEIVDDACRLSKTHGTLCAQLRAHLKEHPDPEPVADIVAYNFIRCPSRLQDVVECPVLDERLMIVRDELARLGAH